MVNVILYNEFFLRMDLQRERDLYEWSTLHLKYENFHDMNGTDCEYDTF